MSYIHTLLVSSSSPAYLRRAVSARKLRSSRRFTCRVQEEEEEEEEEEEGTGFVSGFRDPRGDSAAVIRNRV